MKPANNDPWYGRICVNREAKLHLKPQQDKKEDGEDTREMNPTEWRSTLESAHSAESVHEGSYPHKSEGLHTASNPDEDDFHMLRVVDDAIEMHASVRKVDKNFHGDQQSGEERDNNFSAHLESVLSTLESRLQAHNYQTVEGELMQRVEVLLASHGIFDMTVVSAFVPLCQEISPQLGQALSKFRLEMGA